MEGTREGGGRGGGWFIEEKYLFLLYKMTVATAVAATSRRGVETREVFTGSEHVHSLFSRGCEGGLGRRSSRGGRGSRDGRGSRGRG